MSAAAIGERAELRVQAKSTELGSSSPFGPRILSLSDAARR